MLCDACGTENRAGSRFCDHCGSPLSVSCRACGEPNRADALFCASCGASIAGDEAPARVAPATERRQVSVLFADLVGFTSFAEGRDPEHVRALQQRFFESASEAIARHGGAVEKFIGDAVMAVWGTPVAREDDAQRAVRAGLEVVRSAEALGHELTGRAGVVTGEAAVAIGATNQGMVAGDMVNTASRLQSAAGPGHVLADQPTVQATSGTIAYEPVEELALKGKAEPMRAWRATRPLSARVADMVEPPFVGRAEELRRLKELLHGVGRDRRIRIVSITGPAGIGKSRLVEELGIYADGLTEDIYWHTGRSPSYGEGLAFWAIGEMVRRRTGLAEGDDEATTRARVRTTLEDFVEAPEERAWIEPAMLALLGIGETRGSESLFAAWRTLFERIAARGSVVLVFEDLQWADSGTLEFIEHLLDWSRNQPILVISLARPELIDTRPGWGTARSNSTAMALEPMSDAEMRELLAGLLPGLPEPQAAAIVARAEGMPLYAVEMVRSLLADGRVERRDDVYAPVGSFGELPIPASLRSLIASRLDALPPDDRALLQHASVLGLAFGADALAAVTARPEGELEPRLLTLVRRELLEIEADPRSPERGQYRFVQSLIREVAYDTLALRERRSRHLAAARHLEMSESEETAGALATHYLAAYRASDEGPEADAVGAQACITLVAAAERAAGLGAHEQAVQNIEHALDLTRDPRDRARLLERAATFANAANAPTAAAFAEQAIELHRGAGDEAASVTATALLGDILLDDARVHEADELLTSAVARITGAGDGDRLVDDEVAAALFATKARAEMRLDHNAEALDFADRALVIAERHNLERTAVTALVNKASAYGQLGRQMESSALLEAAIRHAEQAGMVHVALRARMNLANTLADSDPPRAIETFERSLELSERAGDRNFYIASIVGYADLVTMLGTPEAWGSAEDLASSAIELGASGIDLVNLKAGLLFLSGSRGEDIAARVRELDELVSASTDPRSRFVPTMAGMWQALFERNWREVLDAADRAAEMEVWTVLWASIAVTKAALMTGDRAAIATALSRTDEIPLAGRWSSLIRRRIAAVLDASDGRRDEAFAGFVEVLDGFQTLGLKWEVALTVLDGVLALPGDPRVVAWEPDARATFDALGASAWIALLEEARVAATGATAQTSAAEAPART